MRWTQENQHFSNLVLFEGDWWAQTGRNNVLTSLVDCCYSERDIFFVKSICSEGQQKIPFTASTNLKWEWTSSKKRNPNFLQTCLGIRTHLGYHSKSHKTKIFLSNSIFKIEHINHYSPILKDCNPKYFIFHKK